jgi:hypothetical protein
VPIGRSRVGGRLCYLTSRLFFRCMLWTRCSIRRSSEIFFFIFQAICTSQTQSKVDVVFVIQVSGEEGNRFGPCGPLVIRKFSFYERGSHRGEKEDYLLDCCLVSDGFRCIYAVTKHSISCLNIRRKPSSAKHKKWDGDAFVSHTGEKLKLVSEAGKMFASFYICLNRYLTNHSASDRQLGTDSLFTVVT